MDGAVSPEEVKRAGGGAAVTGPPAQRDMGTGAGGGDKGLIVGGPAVWTPRTGESGGGGGKCAEGGSGAGGAKQAGVVSA